MKKSSILIYGLIVLFCFSVVFFVFSFVYSSIEDISVKNFKARLNEINTKEKEFQALENTYREWNNIEETYEKFKTEYMIDFDKYPEFRGQIQSIVAKNGLRVLKLNHKYTNLFVNIRKVAINLQLVGTYRNIKQFIFELEKQNKLILFRDIGMLMIDVNNILGKISMEVYFVK